MSLKPGSQLDEPFQERSKGTGRSLADSHWSQSRPGALQTTYIQDHQLGTKEEGEENGHTAGDRSRTAVSNGDDLALCSPPRTENEVEKEAGRAVASSSLLLTNLCIFEKNFWKVKPLKVIGQIEFKL